MKTIKETVIAKRAAGKSIREIAIEYDINETTLGDWIYFWNNGRKRSEKKRHKTKGKQENQPKEYRYNCINPDNKKELECIIAASRAIPWQIFIKKIDEEYIKDFEKRMGIKLKEEQYAKFYKSITPEGEKVYYFKFSGIEYIFY